MLIISRDENDDASSMLRSIVEVARDGDFQFVDISDRREDHMIFRDVASNTFMCFIVYDSHYLMENFSSYEEASDFALWALA